MLIMLIEGIKRLLKPSEFESRSGEVYSIQHYVFVSDLRQVGGFLRVLWFPSPIKLTGTT
jgi:hypothetical protein